MEGRGRDWEPSLSEAPGVPPCRLVCRGSQGDGGVSGGVASSELLWLQSRTRGLS